ncbi:MAG: aminotransferase class I/II-fold pyridoxal phosphate-dependent enzyme [Eubacteriales bacterium]
MKGSLYNELIKNKQKNSISFHMPGDKYGRLFNMDNLAALDVTELEGLDNLHAPSGIILEAQERASKLYQSYKSFFLVNGSTVGILASIIGLTNKGDKILMTRNSHKSVYNAVMLNELNPIYVYPDIINEYSCANGISAKAIEEKLVLNNNIKVVVVTSPTYEGIMSNIKEISKVTRKYDIPLIVDEAHGAHLKFHSYFPESALDQGGDIVIHSLHKTLPALTQTGLLHINSDKINDYKIKQLLSTFQSSSPSYILMASMDYCLGLINDKGKELFHNYIQQLEYYTQVLREKLLKIKIMNRNIIKNKYGFDIDPSKLLFYCGETNITGNVLVKKLREKYNIQLELSNILYGLGMTSISNIEDDYKALVKSLKDIDSKIKKKEKSADKYDKILLEQALLPHKAINKKTRKISIIDCENCIAGEYIIPYPPGIPLVVPGEIITKDTIECLFEYKKHNMSIIGLSDLSLEKINIIEEVTYAR